METNHNVSRGAGLQWFGYSDRGKIRVNNEDSFLALQFDASEVHLLGKMGSSSLESKDFAFAVGDGMGGSRAGDFASRIAVEKITRLLPRSFQQSAVGMAAGFADVLTELFDQIHRALVFVGTSYEECHGMQSTLTLCWFTPGWMYFGHLGDTRLYYLPAKSNVFKQLSQDDTHVGWLYRQGELTEWQARNHPRRKVLQKALGGDNQFVQPQVGAVAYEPGDVFLLASDGLVEGLNDAQMQETLCGFDFISGTSNVASDLVLKSVESSGEDNTTSLIIKVW